MLLNHLPRILLPPLPLQYKISVYQGISPSLLATLSLSQGIKGNTHSQLIDSLQKNNIIQHPLILSCLRKYDRKYFVEGGHCGDRGVYLNKPVGISGGQNMTDIFTHSIILQKILQHLQQTPRTPHPLKILDIGTGHGYLAYTLCSILQKFQKSSTSSTSSSSSPSSSHKIHAIDINPQSIQFCQKLKNKFKKQPVCDVADYQNIMFQAVDLETVVGRGLDYDVVVGGFYITPKMHQMLVNGVGIGDNRMGIWAADSPSGQSLYTFTKNKSKSATSQICKTEIMSTMFSMPTIKTSVSKYFIEDSSEPQPQPSPSSSSSSSSSPSPPSPSSKSGDPQSIQDLKQKIKQICEQENRKAGKKLSLQELNKIQYVEVLLKELKELQKKGKNIKGIKGANL